MPDMQPRPYQLEGVADLRHVVGNGYKRPVLQCPTGGGKTHMAVMVIKAAVEKGKYVLFLAPRRELIYQAHQRLWDHGVQAGVIMAGEPREIWARVQVASFDTLHVRAVRTDKMELPKADIVIVDEAHLSISATRQNIISSYPNAVIIGLTATPFRLDSGMICSRDHFLNHICYEIGIKELIRDGYLCSLISKAGERNADPSQLHVRGGEFIASEAELLMNTESLVASANTSLHSSTWSMSAMSAILQPALRSGSRTVTLSGVTMSAVSAMKCTPAKITYSTSLRVAANKDRSRLSPRRSPR